MIELLALPRWDTPPRTLAEWIDGLAGAGRRPEVVRVPPDGAWLEMAPLRLRGYAVLEGGSVSAVNFELSDPDPDRAMRLVEAAAVALAWDVYPDDEDDDD